MQSLVFKSLRTRMLAFISCMPNEPQAQDY